MADHKIIRTSKDGTPAAVHEAAAEVLNKVWKAKALLTCVGKDLEHSAAEDRYYYAVESIVELLEEACTDITCDVLKDNARQRDVIGVRQEAGLSN